MRIVLKEASLASQDHEKRLKEAFLASQDREKRLKETSLASQERQKRLKEAPSSLPGTSETSKRGLSSLPREVGYEAHSTLLGMVGDPYMVYMPPFRVYIGCT